MLVIFLWNPDLCWILPNLFSNPTVCPNFLSVVVYDVKVNTHAPMMMSLLPHIAHRVLKYENEEDLHYKTFIQ